MTNAMIYKGYLARIAFDSNDKILVGRIEGIKDGVSFHADSVADLMDAFHEAVDDYLEACAEIGKKPDKPYSGTMYFRVKPELHAKAARAAAAAGTSLNSFGEKAISDAIDRCMVTA